MGPKMNITVALTGAFPAIVILSAVLTLFVSALLLWLYKRSVMRGMNVWVSTEGRSIPETNAQTSEIPSFETTPAPVLEVIELNSINDKPFSEGLAFQPAAQSLRRIGVVYGVAGLSAALVLTGAWMKIAGGGFFLVRFLLLLTFFSWPIILASLLLMPFDRVRIMVVYTGILLTISIIGLIRNPELNTRQLLYLLLFINGPATVLLLAFLNRTIRAVGPMVLAFMLPSVTGAALIAFGLFNNNLLQWASVASAKLGLNALTIVILFHLFGFFLFGLCCWFLLLPWIARRYQSKCMSDQMVTLDAMWMVFVVAQSFTLAFEHWAWIFTGPVAFIAYKIVSRTGFGLLVHTDQLSTKEQSLLLLRVFSLGKRSQRLFDMLSLICLRKGPINLIAGPDLATSTVEPHEFLDFIGGRLPRRFVKGEDDLEQRLNHLDTHPDPDGRYRVNDFFCRADTWQITMQKLADRSDAVLMDLRSFSDSNKGCLFELRKLINSIPIHRLLLVIDDTTDLLFLETALREIWLNLESSSPNVSLTSPVVRCFPIRQQSWVEIKRLSLMLYNR